MADSDYNQTGEGGTFADPNATLTGYRITYKTKNDNKDKDTKLESWINKAGEREAAYHKAPKVEFERGKTYVYDGEAKSNPMKRSEIPGSWLQIRINPQGPIGGGRDRWVFECDLMLRFSDGTIHEQSFPSTTLDEKSLEVRHMLVA